jgi:hypothetical protein
LRNLISGRFTHGRLLRVLFDAGDALTCKAHEHGF